MELKKAGNNLVVITDKGTHVCFDYFRGGYYELKANNFYYRIPGNYTEEDIQKALNYCGVE